VFKAFHLVITKCSNTCKQNLFFDNHNYKETAGLQTMLSILKNEKP